MTVLRLVGAASDRVAGSLRTAWPGPVHTDDVCEAGPYDVVLAWDPYPLERLLAVLAGQRPDRPWWLHTRAAGVDPEVLHAIAAQQAVFTKGTGAHGVAVAEHVLAVLLALCKRVPDILTARRWRVPPDIRELHGSTATVVGLGDVGTATARLLTAFGVEVLGVRRTAVPAPGCAEVLPVARLDKALLRSTILVVAAPLTPATVGLIDSTRLAAMPAGGLLVNVARGPVVELAALVGALRSGHLRGAALDVFDTEPLPPDSPLWTEQNLLITPHCADATEATDDRALRGFLANARRLAAGKPLTGLVDRTHGY